MDTETDVLVVGGGIMGCATAYYLAREGTDVLLVERGDLNTEASGTNAGSLHVQLPSSLFQEESEAMIEARAQTTPLRLEAVRNWRELADELDDDIELAVTGGLMAAVTEAQLRFLEMKMVRERRYGATVELVTGSALFTLAPYLSEHVIGAEYCPLEGRINPTLATPALWRAAVRAGARLWRGTELLALERASGTYIAATSRTRIRCSRVVNAAGPWSGAIAQMAGFSIPVEGAILHMNVTEPAAPFLTHLVQHAGARLTAKQATNGNLLIGGGWPARGESALGHIDVGRESMERNLGIAQSVIPDVARLRLIRCWAGRNIVGDNLPILGPVPGVPNFFNAVTGTGYTGGPVSARLLAEVMAGREPSFDIQPYSVERFARAAAAG
ncbi:MAG: FAD-binding oxidoreductase [Rhodospirillales bacterium]|nr:FAD-binding oxidoreductase [Rhodospirillales bacterium]MDP6804948.1 FAD-binding oxidoreductase [Rhodospirillales bacterium]